MTTPNDILRDLYQQLDGRQIPGGCLHCDAYQIMRPIVDGAWRLTVAHDDDCPRWIELQERTACVPNSTTAHGRKPSVQLWYVTGTCVPAADMGRRVRRGSQPMTGRAPVEAGLAEAVVDQQYGP